MACPDPATLVSQLDEFIVGQETAKKVIAVAVRDRWRRMHVVDTPLRNRITPSNILLSGPTGSGKTEIARRLAGFIRAPFVKVVATRYTEEGFVGDKVNSCIEELAEQAYADEAKVMKDEFTQQAYSIALEEVARAYISAKKAGTNSQAQVVAMIRAGLISDDELEISTIKNKEITYLRDLHWTSPKMSVADAVRISTDHHSNKLFKAAEPELKERAKFSAENRGIVFIDEFDKLVEDEDSNHNDGGFRAKRRGVQKELLSLIEGTEVLTPKLGKISTEHILFICAGAFSLTKPSNMMPELFGRIPVQANLRPLSKQDLELILTTIKHPLPVQHAALLQADGVDLRFTPEGLAEIASAAFYLNDQKVNTGARRLQQIFNWVLEDIKFQGSALQGQKVVIGEAEIKARLGSPEIARLFQGTNYSKFVL